MTKKLNTTPGKSAKAPPESADLYRTLAESSPDCIVILQDGIYKFVNRAFRKTFGYGKQEVAAGLNFMKLVKREDRNAVKKRYQDRLDGIKQSKTYEIVLLTKKGREIPCETSAARILLDKRPADLVVIRDIRERKSTEKSLEESRATSRALLNVQNAVAMIIDRKGTILELNDVFAKMWKRQKEDLLGTCVFDLLPPDLARKRKKFSEQVFRTGKPVNVSDQRAGRWYNNSLYPVHDARGRITKLAVLSHDITEQKLIEEEAEKKLRLSEERNKAILDTFPDMIFRMKSDGTILDYRAESTEDLVLPPEDISGSNLYKSAMPKPVIRKINAAVRRALSSGNMQRIQYSLPMPAGLQTYEARIIKSAPQEIVATVQNITEHKRAETLLSIQRDLGIALSTAQGLSDTITTVLDISLRIEGIDAGGVYLIDEKTGDLFLAAHRGLSQKFIKSASHYPADAPQTRLIKKGESVYIHYGKLDLPIHESRKKEGLKAIAIIPIKDKKRVIAALNLTSHTHYDISSPVRTTIESISGIIADAIIRARAEAALRESENFNREIISSAGEGLIVTDRDSRVLVWNKAMEKITGMTEKQVVGKLGLELFPHLRKQNKVQYFQRALKGESMATPEIPYHIPQTGKSGWTMELYSPHISADGEIIGVVVAVMDITDRKQMEEQMRQVQKMEAVGQLAGGVAHDFNNQLAGIQTYAELMREEVGDNEELALFAGNILLGVKRSSDLTQQLLAFARKGKYLSIPVDIHKIIPEVVALLQRSIDKKVIIKQHLDANPSMTNGDPSQLQNSFLNLALNARDAMPDGGILTIETDSVAVGKKFIKNQAFQVEPGSYIKISVKDTGGGMSEEIKRHVFEPFFTTKGPGKGTGMGLAAVYGTVKNHQGLISVESRPGEGTCMEVYLPQEIPHKPEPQGADLAIPRVSGARVLLVDDEPLVISSIKLVLKQLGFEVTTCNNGKEALDQYRKHGKTFNLVMMDMIMPIIDGREAFLEMKKINPKVKAILLSGYSLDSKTRKIIGEGVLGFIQKPFKRKALIEEVTRVLGLTS